MSVHVDWAEVRRLERHLARVVPPAERDARQAVIKGAMNIKKDWAKNVRASAPKHARAYARSINYDVHRIGRDLTIAVIGPDKSRPQGALGNLLEYGSVHNPPHRDGGRALDAETPRFEAQLEAIAARGLMWW